MRIAIIGAGIGGLTAANALRRSGHEVTVHERAPEPREVGAGIGLWPNAVGALRSIGLAEPILARGEEMRVAEFLTASGRLLTRSSASDFHQMTGDVLALIHRAELLEELLRPLPPSVVSFGQAFEKYEQARDGGDRVSAVFSNGLRVESDLLIGADGLRSAVRRRMLDDGEPRYSGYTCWRGVAEVPESLVAPGYVAEVWGPIAGGGAGARFGITRIGGGRVYWWATLNAPPSPMEQGQLDGAAKATLLRSHGAFCSPVPELIERTDAARIVRNDIYDRPPSRAWSDGRVLLIGDAAHPTTPNLGQGGCMAIEDGVLLPRFLDKVNPREAAAVSRALHAFIAHRFPKVREVVNQSRWFGMIGQWENRLMCWGRDRVMGLVARGGMKRSAARIGRFG